MPRESGRSTTGGPPASCRKEYGYPADDRTLDIWAKPKTKKKPAGFRMEFRDKDGVLVGDSQSANDYSLNSTPVGQGAKTSCHTPTELEFEKVATATVVRIKN